MNKIILMGRLTREPEIRYSQGESQLAIARYTLAVERRKKAGEEQSADFISCIAFGKVAEFAEKYLHQGTKIIVAGRIQTGSYTNKDGQRVYTTDVVVEEQEFAESKNASSNAGYGNAGGSDFASSQGGYQQTSRPSPADAIGPSGWVRQQPFGQPPQRPQDNGWQQAQPRTGSRYTPDSVPDEELPFN